MSKDCVINHVNLGGMNFVTDELVAIYNKGNYVGMHIVECHPSYVTFIHKYTGRTRVFDPKQCCKKVSIFTTLRQHKILYISAPIVYTVVGRM